MYLCTRLMFFLFGTYVNFVFFKTASSVQVYTPERTINDTIRLIKTLQNSSNDKMMLWDCMGIPCDIKNDKCLASNMNNFTYEIRHSCHFPFKNNENIQTISSIIQNLNYLKNKCRALKKPHYNQDCKLIDGTNGLLLELLKEFLIYINIFDVCKKPNHMLPK
ncbi:hypothetical protein FKM82_012235 [Ascaphus truei]